MAAIRPYDPGADEAALHALWRRGLPAWPVSRAELRAVLDGGHHLVAEAGGRVVGFAATRSDGSTGGLLVLLVDPAHRRRGVGRALHGAALDGLRARGARQVRLGAAPLGYFWCGVPTSLPDAWAFFAALGWAEVERSYDLVRDLRGYATPPGVLERVEAEAVRIDQAEPGDAAAVLALQDRIEPRWRAFYEWPLATGELGDVLVARGADGIVGTTLVLDPRSRWRQGRGFAWTRLLGTATGGPGALGVVPEARGRGIGLALAARATEELAARGLRTSYVGWTWLVDWYGRLGFRVWVEYRMSTRSV